MSRIIKPIKEWWMVQVAMTTRQLWIERDVSREGPFIGKLIV
jgi:hypothetical protein